MTARSTLTYSPGALGPILADLTADLLGWQDMAACAEVDPEIWFPAKDMDFAGSAAKAKAICADCPVQRECLSYVLERERADGAAVLYGIFGGLDPKERHAILFGRAEVTDLESAA